MTIPRISTEEEKPFRAALGQAIRGQLDEMHEGLLRLTDEQITACLSLCVLVSGYVAIDVCGRQWPNEKNLRRIAEVAAETGGARAGLTAEESYAYLRRVVLLGEPLETALSPVDRAATLSFVITGELLLGFHPADQEWWEYLNKIEEFSEVAFAVDLDLLPALMLRSRRVPSPEQ